MRLQYCLAQKIPLCFINLTYILDGKISEFVELKKWKLKQQFPNVESNVICATPEKAIVQVRTDPDANWVQTSWDLEKAKALVGPYEKSKFYKHNPIKQLVVRCLGDLCDILLGVGGGDGINYSAEEINDILPEDPVFKQELKPK